MPSGFARGLAALALALTVSAPAFGQTTTQNGGDFSTNLHPRTKVPANVILVKGAWSSASDSTTAVPEGGSLINNVVRNRYFGITYPLPPDWIQKYAGPPPSDSGRYVLAQIWRPDTYKGDARGNILITAQDMFFTPLPRDNALQLVDYARNHLQADYELELKPTQTEIAGRPFAALAYWSPVAELHWYVLATEIRCHAVEFVFMNRDQKTLESTVLKMSKMKLPEEASPTGGTGGGGVPVCIKDYASDENVIDRVDPVFSEQRFNPVPVRIIINKEGKVKFIHFLSAFPDQTKAISDALRQWKFRPYLLAGHRVEVETGVMFGRAPHPPAPARHPALQPHLARRSPSP
ncbi:MAG: energy transducer TonB [Candidatus Binataceae bacterium]